jgi:hypothetical protein
VQQIHDLCQEVLAAGVKWLRERLREERETSGAGRAGPSRAGLRLSGFSWYWCPNRMASVNTCRQRRGPSGARRTVKLKQAKQS